MFKFIGNIGKVNKIWGLLNEKYFKSLDGKIGRTVIKIEENSESGNLLIVQTNNTNVRSILSENETKILNEIKLELGVVLTKITVLQ